MKDINAKIRKCNSKMISILNHCGFYAWAYKLRKENKELRKL